MDLNPKLRYLNLLPSHVSSTLSFKKEEVEELAGTPLYKATKLKVFGIYIQKNMFIDIDKDVCTCVSIYVKIKKIKMYTYKHTCMWKI